MQQHSLFRLVSLFLLAATLPAAAQDEPARRPRQPVANPAAAEEIPASLDGGMTLNRALLANVSDNTIGLQFEDRPAYFNGLWLCRQLEPRDLARLAEETRQLWISGKPADEQKKPWQPFVEVFQNPEAFRGHPVTLHGYFRKLVKYDPGKNDLGFRHVYEGWMYTDDSQSNPAVVIFTKKPDQLPVGADITEEVHFTGYFLKMYGYHAQDTTRRAPLFVAGEVTWIPHRPANERATIPTWAYVTTALVVLAAIVAVVHLNQDRTLHRTEPVAFDPQFRGIDSEQRDVLASESTQPPPEETHH